MFHRRKNMEIDETKLPQDLFVIDQEGKKTLDFSKIKTIQDVQNALNAKEHVKNELNTLKEKYKGVDLDKYNSLLAAELENNKDVLNNPVYKNLETQYNNLQTQLQSLQNEMKKRDEDIFKAELKDKIRSFKGVEVSAVDDILYRMTNAGFTKTEKGILSKEGQNVESYLENLKNDAPHLFKRTIGIRDQQRVERLQSATKNNSLLDVLKNCPRKN